MTGRSDVSYHDMDEILGKLREGITLAQSVLAERTAGLPPQQHAGNAV